MDNYCRLTVGVIENNDDPQKLGRLQVRIFDAHDDDLQKVPTDKLPWAHTSFAANMSNNSSIPPVGEWVLCSFLDGSSSQVPVVLGVLPGLVSGDTKQPDDSGLVISSLEAEIASQESQLNSLVEQNNKNPTQATQRKIGELTTQINTNKDNLTKLQREGNSTPQRGFRDTSSQLEANSRPKQPAYSAENTAGKPSLPVATRSIVGTSLDWVNGQLTHQCDTTAYIKRAMGFAIGTAREIAYAIREGLKALMKALGITPAASGISSILKSVAKWIKRITYWINKINKFAKDVVQAVKEIRAIIDYILSLPAKLLQLFQKCLNEALTELKRGLFDTLKALDVSGGGLGVGDAVKEVVDSTKSLVSATQQLATIPSQISSAFSTPSSMTDAQKEKLLNEVFSTSSFSKTTMEAPG